ncbi:MAG: septum formation inhibitor Maf, partial [Bacteroidota bacterium]
MRYLVVVVLLAFTACQTPPSETNQDAVLTGMQSNGDPMNDTFKQYWYNGEAELSSYSLQQARYGEIHEGEAVMV